MAWKSSNKLWEQAKKPRKYRCRSIPESRQYHRLSHRRRGYVLKLQIRSLFISLERISYGKAVIFSYNQSTSEARCTCIRHRHRKPDIEFLWASTRPCCSPKGCWNMHRFRVRAYEDTVPHPSEFHPQNNKSRYGRFLFPVRLYRFFPE